MIKRGVDDFTRVCKYCRKGATSELNNCTRVVCPSESIMAGLNRFPVSAIDLPKRSTNQN